ncbi:uncharacterized protein LACBIDRAFT_317443 [Laccaria bicolor S238N-H82]|uniref:Predicted protein n=1 Tax=Laccaria bicolor (strain S238N-H82 / ATCC MYA-4686) TaxID=486041 RepID=B0E1S9_LACBS|nr:uncharacterized protein LACBIDRAFT_317443 [Laccaria bicolor S238N-H82]EDQ99191.1 predicted protein [Laccaria bicolor S238N-H82]|eukprot:XP_001890158.1 predicted protein [Laccaria bicolor S238N-H82]
MHGPLREIYLRQTNFKDVVPQILTFDHWRLISLCIRERIDVYDASHATSKTSQEEESEEEVHINPYKNGKLKIGAKQPPETIHNIEMQLKDTDVAFKDFRKKLIPFLNQFCVVHNIPRPENKYFTVDKHTTITEFRYLHIHYESCVTWRKETDLLRCNPSFNNAPRYDCVMVKMSTASDVFIFARLIFIFTFTLRDLGLIHLRAKHRREAEFIPVGSIIRGAYIVPEFEKPDEYHVVDTVDTDMFLRLRRVEAYRFLNY